MNFLIKTSVFLIIGFEFVFSVGLLSVLHLSFHAGCIKDFEHVAQQLNLNLTSWHVSGLERAKFDGIMQMSNDILNISHNRAQCIWDLNKNYFNQFDVILTSDTAPLARIFLQNGWQKPLIIWICNRFDARDCTHGSEPFPDIEYYYLFRKAAIQKNVFIIGYTAFEHFYAHERRVNTGNLIIKPCGSREQDFRDGHESYIPQEVCKEETFFVIPRAGGEALYNKCKEMGIPVYTGAYNGPTDLKNFKGILHSPYTWSNLALFENIQYGLPHFVPSARLVRQWFNDRTQNPFFCFFHLDVGLLELCEWYAPEHKDIIIYFDSWEDLKYKIETTDFDIMRKRVKSFAELHNQEMIGKWREVFDKLRRI